MSAFADRLVDGVRSKSTPLCIGVDPFPDRIPELFGPKDSPTALYAFVAAIIEHAARHAAVVKPQLGLFEQYGADGYRIAIDVVDRALDAGLVVILDAKRGDIGTTAEGYARSALGPPPGFDADCVTVNPYMGKDTLEPFLSLAETAGKGVAVLVRTSNPGARDVQDLDAGGAPVWRRVAEMIAPEAARLKGACGWSGLMAVAGATYPDEARALRTILSDSLFLVPGYGAQGAPASDAIAGFVTGKYGREGGVVSSSRAVSYPPAAQAAKTLEDWRAAVDDAMAGAAAELRAACSL